MRRTSFASSENLGVYVEREKHEGISAERNDVVDAIVKFISARRLQGIMDKTVPEGAFDAPSVFVYLVL